MFLISPIFQPLVYSSCCIYFKVCMHHTKLSKLKKISLKSWGWILTCIGKYHFHYILSEFCFLVNRGTVLGDGFCSQFVLLFVGGLGNRRGRWRRKEKSILRTWSRERRILKSKLKIIARCASNNISTKLIVKWNGAQHPIINVSPSCCMEICGQVINKQMVLSNTCLYHNAFTSIFFFFFLLNCKFPLMKTLKILKPISALGAAYRQASTVLKRERHLGETGHEIIAWTP